MSLVDLLLDDAGAVVAVAVKKQPSFLTAVVSNQNLIRVVNHKKETSYAIKA